MDKPMMMNRPCRLLHRTGCHSRYVEVCNMVGGWQQHSDRIACARYRIRRSATKHVSSETVSSMYTLRTEQRAIVSSFRNAIAAANSDPLLLYRIVLSKCRPAVCSVGIRWSQPPPLLELTSWCRIYHEASGAYEARSFTRRCRCSSSVEQLRRYIAQRIVIEKTQGVLFSGGASTRVVDGLLTTQHLCATCLL